MKTTQYQPDYLIGYSIDVDEPIGNMGIHIYHQPTQLLFKFTLEHIYPFDKPVNRAHIWQFRDEFWKAECISNPLDCCTFKLRRIESGAWEVLKNTIRLEDKRFNEQKIQTFLRGLN